MYFLDQTLPLPAENLALDEALLAASEAGEIAGGILRLWEPDEHFVVLGRSSDPAVEVNLAACRARNIPVLRRASGGGTILTGPGCLMYAVVLSYDEHPATKSITHAHQFVLNRIATALAPLFPGITLAGTSDLAYHTTAGLQKFSGNALRAKRTHFLYHGTLLYNFDLDLVATVLAQQTREPQYRAARAHREFIANLPLSREQIVTALTAAWNAKQPLNTWPQERMRELVKEREQR
jgi:lipoate-protein ligase A